MDKELLEKLYKNNLLYLVLVSLISADTLISIENCEKSLESMVELEKLLPETDIPEEEKIKIKEYIKKGFSIIKSEKTRLKGS